MWFGLFSTPTFSSIMLPIKMATDSSKIIQNRATVQYRASYLWIIQVLLTVSKMHSHLSASKFNLDKHGNSFLLDRWPHKPCHNTLENLSRKTCKWMTWSLSLSRTKQYIHLNFYVYIFTYRYLIYMYTEEKILSHILGACT